MCLYIQYIICTHIITSHNIILKMALPQAVRIINQIHIIKITQSAGDSTTGRPPALCWESDCIGNTMAMHAAWQRRRGWTDGHLGSVARDLLEFGYATSRARRTRAPTPHQESARASQRPTRHAPYWPPRHASCRVTCARHHATRGSALAILN